MPKGHIKTRRLAAQCLLEVLKQMVTTMKMIITLLLVISLAACASGSSIVTGTKRTPISTEEVKLYTEAPIKYDVIGIVNASSDAGWNEQASVDYAIEELKSQAAKLGANGVLLGAIGESTSTVIGGYGTGYLYSIPVTAKTITGKAIYVDK